MAMMGGIPGGSPARGGGELNTAGTGLPARSAARIEPQIAAFRQLEGALNR
jgi:hypothetical protein